MPGIEDDFRELQRKATDSLFSDTEPWVDSEPWCDLAETRGAEAVGVVEEAGRRAIGSRLEARGWEASTFKKVNGRKAALTLAWGGRKKSSIEKRARRKAS
jgi:hypothetical protein